MTLDKKETHKVESKRILVDILGKLGVRSADHALAGLIWAQTVKKITENYGRPDQLFLDTHTYELLAALNSKPKLDKKDN